MTHGMRFLLFRYTRSNYHKEFVIGVLLFELYDIRCLILVLFQGRRLAAEEWSGDNAKDFFEKLYRLGMCELMHTSPLLERKGLQDSNTEGKKCKDI